MGPVGKTFRDARRTVRTQSACDGFSRSYVRENKCVAADGPILKTTTVEQLRRHQEVSRNDDDARCHFGCLACHIEIVILSGIWKLLSSNNAIIPGGASPIQRPISCPGDDSRIFANHFSLLFRRLATQARKQRFRLSTRIRTPRCSPLTTSATGRS